MMEKEKNSKKYILIRYKIGNMINPYERIIDIEDAPHALGLRNWIERIEGYCTMVKVDLTYLSVSYIESFSLENLSEYAQIGKESLPKDVNRYTPDFLAYMRKLKITTFDMSTVEIKEALRRYFGTDSQRSIQTIIDQELKA